MPNDGLPESASPWRSPLLGLVQRVAAGARYAIYPLGRYTRACFEDTPASSLTEGGRRFVGFIDDHAGDTSWRGFPVASLSTAAGTWQLDTVILTRDTPDRAMYRRLEGARFEGARLECTRLEDARLEGAEPGGVLKDITIVEQPAPELGAMLAHLGTYSPGCRYEEAFIQTCRAFDVAQARCFPQRSTLVCTMDAELPPSADAESARLFTRVVAEMARRMAEFGFRFSLCVQLHDTPGVALRTPDDAVRAVIDAFGESAIELHGLDHSMPVEGYTVAWFEEALDDLAARFGARCRYWAPPGWTLCWRTLKALGQVPRIRAVRGLWSGVNMRQPHPIETMRFPYRVGSIHQIPYSYVDWMFADIQGRRLDRSAIAPLHERSASLAAEAPCLMETIAHPFRLVGDDYKARLDLFSKTLKSYARHDVTITDVASVLESIETAGALPAVPDPAVAAVPRAVIAAPVSHPASITPPPPVVPHHAASIAPVAEQQEIGRGL